jgi:hypothetical protein
MRRMNLPSDPGHSQHVKLKVTDIPSELIHSADIQAGLRGSMADRTWSRSQCPRQVYTPLKRIPHRSSRVRLLFFFLLVLDCWELCHT